MGTHLHLVSSEESTEKPRTLSNVFISNFVSDVKTLKQYL